MKLSLNDIVFTFIIIMSFFFLFPKTIEGNTCQKNSDMVMINDPSITCENNEPNTVIYNNYIVKCNDNKPYYTPY